MTVRQGAWWREGFLREGTLGLEPQGEESPDNGASWAEKSGGEQCSGLCVSFSHVSCSVEFSETFPFFYLLRQILM